MNKRVVPYGRRFMATAWIGNLTVNAFGGTAAVAERKRDADIARLVGEKSRA